MLVIGILQVSYLQAALISGQVKSGDEAVPFANIYIIETGTGVSCDMLGMYSIELSEPGTYSFQVSATGMKKLKVEVEVTTSNRQLDFEMDSYTEELDEVVITGTMKESYISESPVKVEVLSAEFFKTVPNNNIMEAIQTVNGVQEQIACGVCGTNDIHINGMEGPYTLMLIDGMPIMSALASVYGFNGIPNSLIERVEIIKGPSSTLYGTEAVGGVINIITKRNENMPLAYFNSFYTSHQEFNGDLAITPRIGNKLSTTISANYYNNQYRMDFNNDNFTDIPLNDRLSLFNKWEYKANNGFTSSMAFRYYNEDRFGGTMQWTPEDKGSSTVYGETINTNRIELISSLRFNKAIKFDFSYNMHKQDSYYGASHYKADQQVLFGNLLWLNETGRHDLIVGLTARYNEYKDNSLGQTDEHRLIPGLFVQDEFTITEKSTLLGGVRFDYHEEHGLIFSPRVNLKQKLGTYTTLRVNFGTGFRQVNLFTEEHAALTGSRQVLVVGNLEPEESYNATLNLNHVYTLGEGVGTIDFDVFYTYYTNKIIPDYETDPNLIVYDNLPGYGVTRGGAISIHHTFQFPVKVKLGATVQDVYQMIEDEQGNLVRENQVFAPFIAGTFGASYTLKKAGLIISYTGNVVGPQHLPTYEAPFERLEISPWFSLQNVQVTKTFNCGLELYAAVKNLLNYTQDSPLVDPANPFSDNFDTAYAYGPMQVRRFVGGLRYSFN